MSAFSVQALEEKISRLSLSQDSIETLSLWITQYKAHGKESLKVWLDETKKASADKRLVLFYLANDILQNCSRRGADIFLELFQDPLRHAVSLIGGQKIQTSVERMFRIWKERKVYSNSFLKELEMLIEPVRKAQVNEALPDFKLPLLRDALSEFAKFEAELKIKSSHLSNLRVDISNPTTSLSMLKDKSAGGQVSQHFEEASQKLQEYTECLVIEVNERINILDMLKECKIFTTYRIAELQRIIADYKTLSISVKELKDKIDHRMKDLERAKSTATSDPGAKEDITDVGDMEIESDGEESQKSTPKNEPEVLKPVLFSAAPGMIATPPMAAYPRPPLPPAANGSYPHPPPHTSTFRTRVPPPPGQPSFGQVPRARLGTQFQNRPMLDPIGRGLAQRPRLLPPQRPPPRRPPPPQHFQGHSLQVNNRGIAPPAVRPRLADHNYRGIAPPTVRARLPVAPPPDENQGHTISSSAVLYKKPAEEEGAALKEAATAVSGIDSKPSLDERLKDMMLNKKFSGSVLDKPVETDMRPYSPSAGEDMAEDQLETDNQSLPTPSSDSPTEDSPKPNMDNPILKALYKSQASPEQTTLSLVPDYDQEDNEELSSDDLKNILIQVKSSEPNDPSDKQPSNNDSRPVAKAAKIPAASEIKITPTLTNLLDEIFPKISQSLISGRKRKQEGVNDATKMPRLLDTPPKPLIPPTQSPAGPKGVRQVRPPLEGVRVPPGLARLPLSPAGGRIPLPPGTRVPLPPGVRIPLPPGARVPLPPGVRVPLPLGARVPLPLGARVPLPLGARVPLSPGAPLPPTSPMAKFTEGYPHPFNSFERPRLPHLMESRFVRPGNFIGGMHPPMGTYGAPRMFRAPVPGYRPPQSRYA